MEVEGRWNNGQPPIEQTPQYKYPTLFEIMSDPNLDLFLQFFKKLWPKPTSPMRQIAETLEQYQTRLDNSSVHYDNWVNNIIITIFSQHKSVNVPYMNFNAPPAHMWLVADQPSSQPFWTAGNYLLFDWCGDGIVPFGKGPDGMPLWNNWLQSPTLGDALKLLIPQIPQFTNTNKDYTLVPADSVWGYGGIMGTLYPDTWHSELYPPLQAPIGYGQVVGFPDFFKWVDPFPRGKNCYFPLPNPTQFCPCPTIAYMAIMEKIWWAFQNYVNRRQAWPIGDPIKWPSDTEMIQFLDIYYDRGLAYCGFKDDRAWNFPPSWRTMVCFFILFLGLSLVQL
jgi:hypothetical protein